MSFGEAVFPAGFNQKIAKGDLIVKEKYRIPQRHPHWNTLEGSRSHITKARDQRMTCGAARPHYQAAHPLVGPPVSQFPTSVSHRL